MKEFDLEIMTPERHFFEGRAEGLTVTLPDGLFTILGGHAPMVAALEVGELRYKIQGEWRECAASEGFLEVMSDGHVIVFVQACENADEIDAGRARAAAERAKERLSSSESIREYEMSRIALARAMNRLKVKGRSRYV
jgi:F-type H+-transporting ATPase subunit epsilon